MRVLLAALGLSALSFAAGVAGDLSVGARHPEAVVVSIPPLPPNAVRAHPLPPMTDSAEAAEVHMAAPVAPQVHRHRARHASQRHAMSTLKPRTIRAFAMSKLERNRFVKWDA